MAGFGYSPVGTSNQEPPIMGASRLLLVAPAVYLLLEKFLDKIPPSVLHHWVQAITAWRRVMAKRGLLGRVTMAQLLLALPLLYLSLSATNLAIWAPTSHHSLSHSGRLTSYAMTCTFLSASKSHSVISLITGLSFDKIINYHTASAILTFYMACLHGIQIAYFHRGDNKTHHHHDHDHDHEDSNAAEPLVDHHEHDPEHYYEHAEDEDEGEHDHDHDHDHDGHYYYHRMLHTDSIHAYLGPDPSLWKFFFDGNRNQSGFIVLTSLLLLVITSLFATAWRQRWFEGWLVSHVTGFTMILIYGLIHGADIFVFVVIWLALDWAIRYGFMAQSRYPKQAQLTRICDNVTHISFPKSQELQFQPGQFLQIAIPSLTSLQFHPFSIASVPEDDKISLYVRALPGVDTWTRLLHDLVSPREQQGEKNWKQNISTLNVRMLAEGPYGSIPAIIGTTHKYSMAVLICGGIGVTPCLSIARALLSNPSKSLQKLWYIWAVRDEAMVEAIPPPTRDATASTAARNGTSHNAAGDNGIELVEQSPKITKNNGTGESDRTDTLATSEMSTQYPLELQTDIYITQMPSKFDNGDDDSDDTPSSEEDPSFEYHVHRGRRPDVHAILKQIQTEAVREGWNRVFVMGSGPITMLEELQVACQNSQLQNLQIDYEQEVFGYY